ncbi:hypothetical protein DM01DRAFT_256213, partial [Hesseltinella vesiculosa]
FSKETVDASPSFIEVLDLFQQFMAKYSLFQDKTAVFVTDGPFDIRDFVTKECRASGLTRRPEYFCQPWVNIRELYREFYKFRRGGNIGWMLSHLDMTFTGRQHSGLDDARNLVTIAQRMKADGCLFKSNIRWYNNRRR